MANKIPKIGRPKKSKSTKKSAKIFINLTEEQKKKLVEKSEELEQSLSYICLQALKDKNLI